MEIEKLRTFVDLAQTLSFSKTAENMYTSQSTVSKKIRSLEKELGSNLFDRNNKNVELSDFGRKILTDSQKIVDLEDSIVQKAREYHQEKHT